MENKVIKFFVKSVLSVLMVGLTFSLMIISPLKASEITNPPDSNGTASIEYNDELQGYILHNVTVNDVLDAFQKSGEFKQIGEGKLIKETNPVLLNTFGLNALSTAAYTTDYVVSRDIDGAQKNSKVTVNYTCNMKMTTVKYNGVSYAQFVSFNLKPTYWLGSGSYVFNSSGTNAPKYSITNGGASLRLEQTIQIETATAISVSGGLSAGWVSFGGGTSTTHYYRSPSKTYTTTKNLPLYNIIH